MQARREAKPGRGILARPLDALCFLAPMILFSEIVAQVRGQRVVAFDLMRHFIGLFGAVGAWAPPAAVVGILLATQAFSGRRWKIHWPAVGLMYAEAMLLTVPLLMLSRAIPLQGSPSLNTALLDQIALSLGAGIYEELVFRLVLITLLVVIGADLLKISTAVVAGLAILVSALAFAGHHHPPIGVEPFHATTFLFRCAAGAYLSVVFWFRGYGPAAGCHAAYNVVLTLWGHV